MISNDLFPETELPAARTGAPVFSTQLRAVQAADEDFEWYPTTDEILAALKKDLRKQVAGRWRNESTGFLDIGAGNGKVLASVSDIEGIGNAYAIEKSHTLMEFLPKEVFILGCDFWHTSLVDKEIGYIFSNPPYSRFQEWSAKIVKEARLGTVIYLVIPDRWEKPGPIAWEIQARKATTKILGSFDFENAEDRTARAKVHLLKIEFPHTERWNRDEPETDPFTRFFHETFTFPPPEEEAKPFEEQLEETRMVQRMNFIEALCHLYQARMMELQRNYQAILDISPEILKEFEISRAGLCASLKMKLSSCKKEYWQRLFDGMQEIKSRLTVKSRRIIQGLMESQTGIDFNRDNCYAVVLWVVKNANGYFDQQLIDTYEHMIDHANVENYVSNKRIFKWDRFTYRSRIEETATHYRLKVGNRMVLHSVGGLRRVYSWEKGISESACDFMSDLITVATNLGWTIIDKAPAVGEFDDSNARVWRFRNESGVPESLFKVRAFQNNNMHFQFHPDFIHALNVQHGKLKGWLRNDAEAVTELEVPAELASRFFDAGFRLTGSALALMAPADTAA